MVKNVFKRFTSIMMVTLMVLMLLPVSQMTAYAASFDTGAEGLTAESSGDATWTGSGGTIKGSVTTQVEEGCLGDDYTAKSGKLTLTNTFTGNAILSFTVTPTLDGGSVKVGGTSYESNKEFTKVLTSGETVDIEITSNDEKKGTR